MPVFDALGVKVYALSYDEQDALRDFKEAFGITYQLLSDPDSKIIREFGILNTLIDPNDHPWFGIPFPGTYVIDGDGNITHKFFENNLVLRVGPDTLLRALDGSSQQALTQEMGEQSAADAVLEPLIEPVIALEGSHLSIGVLKHLDIRFELPGNKHLYAAPAPQGMIAVSVTIDEQPRLVVKALERPASETHTMASTDETFEVHQGHVVFRVPLCVNAPLMKDSGLREIDISGEIAWQTCDDQVCDIPQKHRFSLTLPVGEAVASELGASNLTNVKTMNAAEHFQQMTRRRQ